MRGNDSATVHLDVLWAFSKTNFIYAYSFTNDFKSIYMLFYKLNLALHAVFGGLKWFFSSQIAVSKCRLLSFFCLRQFEILKKCENGGKKNDRPYLKKGLRLGHKTSRVWNLIDCECNKPTNMFISPLYIFCQTEGQNHFQGNYNGERLF